MPKIRRTKNQCLNEEQLKKQKVANEIRRLGDHQHNLKTDNPDDFAVSRRPKKCGKTKTVKDFLPCLKCHEWEATNSLTEHVTKCTKKNLNDHIHLSKWLSVRLEICIKLLMQIAFEFLRNSENMK